MKEKRNRIFHIRLSHEDFDRLQRHGAWRVQNDNSAVMPSRSVIAREAITNMLDKAEKRGEMI